MRWFRTLKTLCSILKLEGMVDDSKIECARRQLCEAMLPSSNTVRWHGTLSSRTWVGDRGELNPA